MAPDSPQLAFTIVALVHSNNKVCICLQGGRCHPEHVAGTGEQGLALPRGDHPDWSWVETKGI